MRSASGPPARAIASRARPNVSCVDAAPAPRGPQRLRHRHRGRARSPRHPLIERNPGEEAPDVGLGDVQPRERFPLLSGRHAMRSAHRLHLVGAHQPRMVVLVTGERESETLDGVGEEAGRPVAGDTLERFQHALHVVPAEVRHQRFELGVVVLRDQRPHPAACADVGQQAFAPRRPALDHERRVQRIRTRVDPLPKRLAPRTRERLLQLLAVLDGDDVPSHAREQAVEPAEQPIADHRIEALAVVVDHPPQVAHVVLPPFEERLVDVALIELRVPDHRHHPPAVPVPTKPFVRIEIVLDQGRERRHRDPEPHRPGGDVHVVGVLGARRIGLHPAEGTEAFELLPRLSSQQVLDGVEHRARVRLHRDTVRGAEHVHVERGHESHHGCRAGLVPPYLQSVDVRSDVVCVVNHPRREPQDAALERPQHRQAVGACELQGSVEVDRWMGHRVTHWRALILTIRASLFLHLRNVLLIWLILV